MNTSAMADCLFCRIAQGLIPATTVLETEHVIAFRDIDPKAPTHVLVIPKAHHDNLAAMAQADPDLASAVLAAVAKVAAQEGLSQGGYRTVFNTGPDAGQSVEHVHAHVLGGRSFTWPPG